MPARVLVALAAALALADASVVVLALPPLLGELDATVEEAGAVIGAYTLALALALPPAAWLRARPRVGPRVVGAAGLAVLAGASVACGIAESMPALIAWRAVQAVGAAGALAGALALLGGEAVPPTRLWTAAALGGTAIGPALGGALTELLDWRAIFLVQAPLAALAGAACLLVRTSPRGTSSPGGAGPARAGAPSAHPGASTMDSLAPVTEPDAPPRLWSSPTAPPADPGAPPRLWSSPTAPPADPGAPPRPWLPPTADPSPDPAADAPAGAGPRDRRADPSPDPAVDPPAGAGPRDRRAASSPDPAADAPPDGRARAHVADRGPAAWRGVVALALVSAALTAVLFLLVLLLVTGWSLSPLAAAGVVTVLPVVALAGARIPGPPQARAASGAVLLAAGVLALAFVPGDAVGWAIVAQVPAGLGMGLALPALGAPPLWRSGAVGALAVRHAGITLALLALAPVTSAQIDDAVDITRQRGVALVLDARLDPLGKLALANASLDALDPVDPRGDLERTLAREARRFSGERDREAYAELTRRADEALVEGLDQAFKPALLITGGLALVAALVIWPFGPLPGRARVATGAALLALALPVGLALVRPQLAPEPVTLADPCRQRELPGIGGLRGVLQDAALRALDGAACRFGSSREELAIALADEDAARAYEREHGVDPRSAGSLLAALLGG